MNKTISKFAIGLLAFASIAVALAQTTEHQHESTKTAAPQKGMGMMKMGMAMDMGKCMADMIAGAAKLDDLAAMMNASRGMHKMDATAAVVNEMLAQKKKMDAMCMQMMQHMSGMRGMSVMPEKAGTTKSAAPPTDHSKHHGG